MNIIGLVGFIGSGKGTVGDYLVKKHGYVEGDTIESREWREQIDPWWSKKLGRPVTPRWALQYIGTDVFRMHFNTNIWTWNVEKQILNHNNDVIITDARFPNEVNLLREMGGKIIWVKRPTLPEWYDAALSQNKNLSYDMTKNYPDIHLSEWAWIGTPIDATIVNDGTIKDLYKETDKCLTTLK